MSVTYPDNWSEGAQAVYDIAVARGLVDDNDLPEDVVAEILVWSGKNTIVLDREKHRHWTEEERVTELSGRFFSYWWATKDGDISANEAGWEFDTRFVHEVKPVKKVVETIEWVPIAETDDTEGDE